MRILTWNIGCFALTLRESSQYFRPDKNAILVSDTIANINPDFLFLQEFYDSMDVRKIEILTEYPHQMFLDMWYRKQTALVASKKPFTIYESSGFHIVSCEGFKIIPIHLNSYSASRRLEETRTLAELIGELGGDKIVVLGDTNIWTRKGFFLFSKDAKAYVHLTALLNERTTGIVSTNYIGFKLDNVFASQNVIIRKVESPRVRGEYMDHYPLFFEADMCKIKSCTLVSNSFLSHQNSNPNTQN